MSHINPWRKIFGVTLLLFVMLGCQLFQPSPTPPQATATLAMVLSTSTPLPQTPSAPATATHTPTLAPSPIPPTATVTPTVAPVEGIDWPIVIENLKLNNTTVDIKIKILGATTEESLKSGTGDILPKEKGDLFLSLRFSLDGPMNAVSWFAVNAAVQCGSEAHKAIDTMTIEIGEGLFESWRLYYEVPAEANFEACSVQLPDGREIPLGRFFSEAAPGSASQPPSVRMLSKAEAQRVLEEQDIESLASKAVEEYSQEERDRVGTLTYTIYLTQSQPIAWSTGWCTTTEKILSENFDHIRYTFILNGQDIPLDRFVENEYYSEKSKGYCRTYSTVLTDWTPGEHIIQTVMTMDQPINDGWDDYVAGTRTYIYKVIVPPQ